MGVLITQGAEGRIYKEEFLGKHVIVKERFIKNYRHPTLDNQLSNQRLRSEVRCISRCRSAGINTPAIYFIDPCARKVYMEYIENSETVKMFISTNFKEICDELERLAEDMGTIIAQMHEANMVHGDLTTSNFLIDKSTLKLAMIDFGLGQTEVTPEDKAVDLYVLERAILSTHPTLHDLFKIIMSAYKSRGAKSAEVITKLEEVRARGRKRTMIG